MKSIIIIGYMGAGKTIVKVEKLTGYRIMFSYNDVRGLKAQGKVTSKEINKALTQLLGKLPLNYTVEGKFVTIRPKSVSPKVEVVAQDNVTNGNIVILQGKVLDDTGEPVPGVTVKVDGGNKIATMTSSDGSFALQLNRGHAVRVDFSYIGMKPESYLFNCRKDLRNIVIRLTDDASQLNEVVVTGMFNKRRESYTGAAKTVTSQDLKFAGNSNLLNSLSNLDPSFNIVNNDLIGSDPNKLPDITMRGSTALGTDVKSMQANESNKVSSNLPLFIMDGFEVSGLKDGADVAVYSQGGTLMGKAKAGGGSAQVDASGYPGGVYIIKAGGRSLKMIKK